MADAKSDPEPLDPAIVALVDAIARDLAREDHNKQHQTEPGGQPGRPGPS
jgi:hypothetical protein